MRIKRAQFSRSAVFILLAGVSGFAGFAAQAHPANAASAANRQEKNSTEKSPFFCNVKALNPAEWARLLQLHHRLAEARVETQEFSEGYAFRLAKEKITLSDVAEWISLEGRCCPFFDFKIELQRDGGPLWLKVGGADGVKQFLRSEFRILKVE
jgi:hypothetical protein